MRWARQPGRRPGVGKPNGRRRRALALLDPPLHPARPSAFERERPLSPRLRLGAPTIHRAPPQPPSHDGPSTTFSAPRGMPYSSPGSEHVRAQTAARDHVRPAPAHTVLSPARLADGLTGGRGPTMPGWRATTAWRETTVPAPSRRTRWMPAASVPPRRAGRGSPQKSTDPIGYGQCERIPTRRAGSPPVSSPTLSTAFSHV